MKRFAFILCITAVCFLTGCSHYKDANIPDGYVRSEEHWQLGGFQDYTDFCVFNYDSSEKFLADPNYQKITDDDIQSITGYFDHFKACFDAEHRLSEYTFNEACISSGDYCLVRTKEGQPIGGGTYGPYDDYTVYFFDIDTLTLYYIHTNI